MRRRPCSPWPWLAAGPPAASAVLGSAALPGTGAAATSPPAELGGAVRHDRHRRQRGGDANAPIVGLAATPDGAGYWLGGARRRHLQPTATPASSARPGALHLNAPIVGMAATPDGGGYWLVASDGGIFSYGDAGSSARPARSASTRRSSAWPPPPTAAATGWWRPTAASSATATPRFSGSAGSLHLNAPVVGMAATPDGGGYWLVARDGGIFTYGDATFEGSAGALRLNAPVTGMAATPDGGGYWLVARDGGVFTYGDAALLRLARRDDPARPRRGPGRRRRRPGVLAGGRLRAPGRRGGRDRPRPQRAELQRARASSTSRCSTAPGTSPATPRARRPTAATPRRSSTSTSPPTWRPTCRRRGPRWC